MPKRMKENKSFKTYRAAAEHADGQPIINVGGLYVTGNINSLTCIVCIEPDGKHSGEVTVRKLQKGNHNHCNLAQGTLSSLSILATLEKMNVLLQNVKPDHPTTEGELRSLLLGAIAKAKGE